VPHLQPIFKAPTTVESYSHLFFDSTRYAFILPRKLSGEMRSIMFAAMTDAAFLVSAGVAAGRGGNGLFSRDARRRIG
jgi:hypothetical protein